MPLTSEQRQTIRAKGTDFLAEWNSPEGRAFQEERVRRVRFFREELPRRFAQFSVSDFEELISMLWASHVWGNQSHLAQKLIHDNGLETLRDRIRDLVEATDPEAAYGVCLREVKGMGPASITEILAYAHPDRCGIWNRQVREALGALGIVERVNVKKYALSVEEYRAFNRLVGEIGAELQAAGVSGVDHLLVDYFFYFVASTAGEAAPAPGEGRPEEEQDFDHNEIRDTIAEIGSTLGFDASTEEKIARGAVVDVVWRARIANLGLVSYVFEVHRSGSIDSLILNLQKAFHASSVQKVIAVSDSARLRQIREECEGLPEAFRRSLRFWSVREVLTTSEHLRLAMESIGQLGLIEE